MTPKPEVELIPWIHRMAAEAHHDVVRYIRKLPQNSTIGLEATGTDLLTLRKLLADIENSRNLDDRERLFLRENLRASGATPAIQVIHECDKRNIRILPLDSKEAKEARKGIGSRHTGSNLEQALHVIESIKKSDPIIAKTVKETLSRTSQRPLPVLFGFGHTLFLRDQLRALGVPARIKLDLFQKPENMDRILHLLRQELAAPHVRNEARRTRLVDEKSRKSDSLIAEWHEQSEHDPADRFIEDLMHSAKKRQHPETKEHHEIRRRR